MHISCNWLARHVDLDGIDLDDLGRRFTLSVAELEGVTHVGEGMDKVVVGLVQSVQSLEGKKVRLTTVDTGQFGVRSIICGAPNVAPGQHVPVALPGAKFGSPGSVFEIKIAKVAGVESHGMICSESELGISDEHAGIMVLGDVLDTVPPVGTPLDQVFPLRDTLFEVDNKSLTHRPDLWGHRGIAREVAALVGRPLKTQELDVPFTDATPLRLSVLDPTGCPRYSAVTMDGVCAAPSPIWLKLLLHRVGLRAINTLVDATNFAMLDQGNPLHAFDRRQISGDTIVVRRALTGESFTALDDKEHRLDVQDLLITDAERGVALAGVMGGLNSEIKADTTAIVLEAANFEPGMVRMSAQRLGIRTDSSARFEKSLDPRLVEDASRVFLKLVLELCPGSRITSSFMDVAEPFPAPTTIIIDFNLIRRRLGVDPSAEAGISDERINKILTDLGFVVTTLGMSDDPDHGATYSVTVPSWRATKDVSLREDLVEEVGRVFGYDNIPPQPPRIQLDRPDANTKKRFGRRVRDYLCVGARLDEVQTYSFESDPLLRRIGALETGSARLVLKNPISQEMPAMRRTLEPGLLDILERNARTFEDVAVFEVGRVFSGDEEEGGLPLQPQWLSILVARPLAADEPAAALFFELKGILGGLSKAIERSTPDLSQGGVALPWAHPVRQAQLSLDGTVIGRIMDVHPLTLKRLDVKQSAALIALNLDAWRESMPRLGGYTPLPKFPAVFRDFAVLVPREMPAATVQKAIAEAVPELIGDTDHVAFQSVYRGKGVDDAEKSLAWSVTLRRTDRTLKEAEVKAAEAGIWASIEAIGGRPRA